jgi:hypothetical protein
MIGAPRIQFEYSMTHRIPSLCHGRDSQGDNRSSTAEDDVQMLNGMRDPRVKSKAGASLRL